MIKNGGSGTRCDDQKQANDALEIFYSYANEDERYAIQLQKQFVMLKRRGLITDWYGGKIAAGEELSEHVKHLNSAHIILLLISPDFMSSEHHYQIEVSRAMERYKAKETIIVPIILRPTEGWRDAPFGRLQPIPRGNKAITEYRDPDVAFRDVAQEVRYIVEKLKNATPINRKEYKTYYVYEDDPTSSAKIHVSSCSFCNDGQGIKGARLQDNRWYGPFHTVQEAETVAYQTRKKNIDKCNVCHPS